MAQYLKQDSERGFIEDTAEIEKLKFENLRHSILGCMLGDFDEIGNYVINPLIIKELIAMEKYIAESYDNIELCKSCIKFVNPLSFLVSFEGNKVTLSLIEKISYEANFALNSGTYSNVNEYVLDSVETSGEVNINVIYSRWNIKTFHGNEIDVFNCDPELLEKYFGIVNRFKFILESNKILLQKEQQMEEVEASYANEMFQIISHYPKLNEAVLKTIKDNIVQKKNAINSTKPFYIKTFNELFDNAIKQNITVLSDDEKQEFEIEQRNAIVNLNLNRKDVLETNLVSIDDKKTDAPNIIQLKVNEHYHLKSLNELGYELVAKSNKGENFSLIRRAISAIEQSNSTIENLDNILNPERKQFEENLYKLGILKKAENKNANIEQDKAETKTEVKANNNSKPPSNISTNKKASDKKAGGGPSGKESAKSSPNKSVPQSGESDLINWLSQFLRLGNNQFNKDVEKNNQVLNRSSNNSSINETLNAKTDVSPKKEERQMFRIRSSIELNNIYESEMGNNKQENAIDVKTTLVVTDTINTKTNLEENLLNL